MKELFFSIMCLGLANGLWSQNDAITEGVIHFEERINLHRRITDDNMKAMIPEWRINKNTLTFKGDEYLFKPVEEDEDELNGDGGGMQIRMRRPNVEVYKNLATGKSVEQREMAGKKYLIEDTIKAAINWKIEPETKQLLGYECIKATYSDTARKQNFTAWFTNDIPMALSPGVMGGLPGAVLETNVNNGEVITIATKIESKKIRADEVKAPNKGEKISRQDFLKKIEEFRRQNGGNFRVIRN